MIEIPESILSEIQLLQDQGHNIDFEIGKNQWHPNGFVKGIWKSKHIKNANPINSCAMTDWNELLDWFKNIISQRN